LFASVHAGCAISIINNGCNDEILNYLRQLRAEGKIDRLIDAYANRGKIDPLMGEIRATYEPLISVSDADVLFKKNWIVEVEKILDAIPECGMVGHLPDPKKYKGFNATTLVHALFSGKLGREVITFEKELETFALSIGEEPEEYCANIAYTYKSKDVKTIVGAHHFSTTLRREYLKKVPTKPSLKKITGNSEYHYIDRPMDQSGRLRLSPMRPVVWHMGNTWEDWMEAELNLVLSAKETIQTSAISEAKTSFTAFFPYKVRTLLESLFFRTTLIKVLNNFTKPSFDR
jgi:hypothetical protein